MILSFDCLVKSRKCFSIVIPAKLVLDLIGERQSIVFNMKNFRQLEFYRLPLTVKGDFHILSLVFISFCRYLNGPPAVAL